MLVRARLLIERNIEGLEARDKHDAAGAPPAHQHALCQAGLANPALLLCTEQVLSLPCCITASAAHCSPTPGAVPRCHTVFGVTRVLSPVSLTTWAVWLAHSR